MPKKIRAPKADQEMRDQEVHVEIDEGHVELRREETERFMSDPRVRADMELGRLALEAELSAQAAGEVVELEEFEPHEVPPELPEEHPDNAPVVFEKAVPEADPKSPVWVARARKAIPPKDPHNEFEPGRVVDVEMRLYSDREQYRLVCVEDGVETDFWTGRERDGWGAWLAMRRIKVSKDVDYGPVNQLPRVHPHEVWRQKRKAELMAQRPLVVGGRRGRERFTDHDLVTERPSGGATGCSAGAETRPHLKQQR